MGLLCDQYDRIRNRPSERGSEKARDVELGSDESFLWHVTIDLRLCISLSGSAEYRFALYI